MENKTIQINYRVADSHASLEPEDAKLFAEALAAMKTAYAPYSNFSVGAAVALENGKIVRGSNQENIAYPSGLCAERVAIFAASSMYPGVAMRAVAIVASHINAPTVEPSADESVTPCGACRQVIMEYERLFDSPIRIITGAPEGKIIVVDSANTLLPLVFFSEALAKGGGY